MIKYILNIKYIDYYSNSSMIINYIVFNKIYLVQKDFQKMYILLNQK